MRLHGTLPAALFSVLAVLPLPAAAAQEAAPSVPAAELAEAGALRATLESRLEEVSALRQQLAQASPATPLSPTQAARYELKLAQYEEELRQLTGRVEELTYKIDQLQRRLELLSSDVDNRLSRLEPGEGGAAANGGVPPAAAPGAGAAAGGAAGAAAGSAAPRTLGTVSPGDVAALQRPQPQSQQQAAAPGPGGGLPKDQYQRAYDLLAQQRWADAEVAFRSFLEANPQDPLAPNATYWLAETYYARKDYTTAATLFAEGFEKYPNGQKAPDNLLKLGISLANIGRTQDACDTLAALKERYPNAPPTILQRADRQRADLGC